VAEHVIHLYPAGRFWFGDLAWKAECSCGRYRSKRRYGFSAHAAAAGLEHARAKSGQR
jgi:hypothetical protein